MAEQRIIWTALPNGTSDGTPAGALRLSVFVTPRLLAPAPGTQLASFADWLDWPGTVSGVTWRVHVNQLAYPGIVVSAAPSTARWQDVFTSQTRVRGYVFERIQSKVINSYPASKLYEYVRDRYTTLAIERGAEHPTVETLLGTETGLAGLLREIAYRQDPARPGTGPLESNVLAQLQQALAAAKGLDQINHNGALAAPGNGTDYARYFEEHKQFLRREPPPLLPPSDPTPPELDFHQAVAAFADHPPLLRTLGLTIDLEVQEHGPIAPNGEVWVEPVWTSQMPAGSSTDVLPRTLYDGGFRPRPGQSGSDVQRGLLVLDTGDYELLPIDIDGAAIKLMEFATAIARVSAPVLGSGTTDSPTTYAAPALRTGGIGLVRAGRASRLVGNLATSTLLDGAASQNPPQPITLGSDDVTRGVRIDVWDDQRTRWAPLCARVAGPSQGYRFPNTTLPVPPGDEGMVSLGLTSDPDGSPDDLFLGELMARWRGWSLIAPRPGKGLGPRPNDPLQTVDTVPAGPDVPVEMSYAPAPGTLPTLRFGHTYRMRARAADLAGNSLPFDANAPAGPFPAMSPPVFYGRLEPVVSPLVLLRKERTEGESVERLVIRSTRYDTADGDVTPTERHVAVPRTAELVAEEHGVLDDAVGRPDKSRYAMIVQRESAAIPNGTPSVDNYGQPHFDVATLTVPYLPDPIARGAALRGLPGVGPVPLLVPFFDPPNIAWPDSASFRVKIIAGPFGVPPVPPTWNDRTLTVTLAKADVARVRLSSYVDAADLDQLQIWNWILQQNLSSAQLDALRDLVTSGGHWMFTPWRELVLVHAVRQPLVAPTFEAAFAAARDHEGQTDALLTGTVDLDLRSTLRLDVHAEWDELIDADPTPGPVVARAVPLGLTLSPDDPDGDRTGLGSGSRSETRHQFGDTKHRTVYYKAIASTRFAEYFVERATPTLAGTNPVVLNAAGLALGQETVTSMDDATTYRRDVDYAIGEQAGTIARIAGGTIPDNTQVRVAFVVAPIIRSSLEVPENPPSPRGRRVNVLSSARPAAPDVRWVIPTFAWERPAAPPDKLLSVRRGRGLRVYLGRTWWSSGEGEMLGVVLWPNSQQAQPDDAQPFVTMWGRDPVWITSSLAYSPAVGDFPRATRTASAVLLRERGGPVAVAGHPVAFDADRKLWYADIELSSLSDPSYFPFIRLALARYQPDSLGQPFTDGGLYLSPIVLADFAQLAPDRAATITFLPDADGNVRNVDVRVIGSAAPFTQGGATTEVRVQPQRTRRNVDPSDDLAWEDMGKEQILAFASLIVPTWSGTVKLPVPRGTFPMRLLVVESELIPQDGGGMSRRTVFADTIRL